MISAGSGQRVSATYRSHSLAHQSPTWAVRLLLGCLAVFLLLTPAASRQLTAIRVSAGEDLQAAINSARPGTTVLLAAGAHFSGNFVLPARAEAQSFITIRTDGPGLPAEGARTAPAHSGRLAVIQSPNGSPALRTATGAHHWRLENLEFRANRDGRGDIIALGDASQRTREEAAHTLVLDRLYIVGDPEFGQKRAIALNSGATEIRNCYIAGIRGVGMDTQAIGGWNGPGPYVIENNYLEAAGENVMFGGGVPSISGLVPEGITIRRNALSKPVTWRSPIVQAPERLLTKAIRTGGSLGPGAYIYSVVSEKPSGQGTTAVSVPSTPSEVTLGETTSASVSLEWQGVPGASGYRVYRTGPGGSVMWRASDTRFTDTGAAGKPGNPPKRATVWAVKNLFELKNARNVVFEGNVLENNWLAAQNGFGILFQASADNGRVPWATVDNITIANNVIRHVSGGVNIVGQRSENTRVRNVRIVNNLFEDVSREPWGGSGDFLMISGGAQNVTVEQNTVLHTGRVITAYGGSRAPKYIERFVFRNNLLRHNEYGVKGDATGTGEATLARYFPDAVFEGNVLAGGKPSLYPKGNHFPSLSEFDALFEAGGSYRRRRTTAFSEAGADISAIEAATSRTIAPDARATLPRNKD
jgi:Right handed beta helix region